MTINLENEIVSTGYDPITRTCSYVIERGNRRWTVNIPEKDLNAHGSNKAVRRIQLGNVLTQAMTGKADGEE